MLISQQAGKVPTKICALMMALLLTGCETLVGVAGNCNDFSVELVPPPQLVAGSHPLAQTSLDAMELAVGMGFTANSLMRYHGYSAAYPDGSSHPIRTVQYSNFNSKHDFLEYCNKNPGAIIVPAVPTGLN